MSRSMNVICIAFLLVLIGSVALNARGRIAYAEIRRSNNDMVALEFSGYKFTISSYPYRFQGLGVAPEKPAIDLSIVEIKMRPIYWFDFGSEPPVLNWYVHLPLWFLFLLFAIKPTWSLIAWQRRRKRAAAPGHPLCTECGYDLHGNTSAVCPECGREVTSA